MEWFGGKFQDDDDDRKRRLGIDSTVPKRGDEKPFTPPNAKLGSSLPRPVRPAKAS